MIHIILLVRSLQRVLSPLSGITEMVDDKAQRYTEYTPLPQLLPDDLLLQLSSLNKQISGAY